MDGSSNYHHWDGTYDAATGLFHGVFTTNQCSNDKWGYCPLCDPPQYLVYANHSANCINQTVPAPEYHPAKGPHGAQLRGRVKDHLRDRDLSVPEDAKNYYANTDASSDEISATNLEEGGFGLGLRRLVALCTHQPTTPRTNGVAPFLYGGRAWSQRRPVSPLPLRQRLGMVTCCNPSPVSTSIHNQDSYNPRFISRP